MPWDLFHLPLLLPAFVLVAGRVAGIMITAPFFSSPAIPRQAKVLLVLAVATMVFPLSGAAVPIALPLGRVVVGLVGEMAIGLVIGLGFSLIFSGVAIAARLIGQQVGIGAAALFDPVFESDSTAIGELYFFFTLVVFFSIGGHHVTLTALLDTFRTTPLLTFEVTPSVVGALNDLFANAFSFGIRLAGPILVAMFLASLTMGFISRTMPQLNILSVGFGVRVIVGIWMVAASIVTVRHVFAGEFWKFADIVRDALE